MNTKILERLSVDQLFELKAAVINEIGKRIDYSIIPGRTGWIKTNDKVTGQEIKVYVRVTRINAKTISCVEIADDRRKWKVSPEFLHMEGVPIRPNKPTEAPKDLSKTYDVQSW